MLAATNLGNLINMGLLDRNEDRQSLKMNQLMYSALRKFPFVYFAYITDVWYFDFFTRKIDDAKLNEHWWYLVKKYQVRNYSQILILINTKVKSFRILYCAV